jgi:hypothetical protein
VTNSDLTPNFSEEFLSSNNSSTTQLGAGASFTGTPDQLIDFASISITFISDQNCTVQLLQSPDGTHWDIVDTYTTQAGVGDSRTFDAMSSFAQVIVTNDGLVPTTYFRLQTIFSPDSCTTPRSLTQAGNFKVAIQELASQGVSGSSVSGVLSVGAEDEQGLLRPLRMNNYNDLQSVDILNNGTAQSQLVMMDGINWFEALGGPTRLFDRKVVVLNSPNGNFVWNFVSGISVSGVPYGFPLVANGIYPISAGDQVPIYIYSSVSGVLILVSEAG